MQKIDERVQSLSLSPSEFIQVMESHSTGEAKKVIVDFMSSCGQITQEKVDEMIDILSERYGSSAIIAKDLLNKLKKFPPLKLPDIEKDLRELIDLCHLLLFNMNDTPELQFLNIADGAELIRQKLPSFIQDRWMTAGQRFEDEHGRKHPLFEFLIDFLHKQAREISNTNYRLVHPNSKFSSRENKTVKVLAISSNVNEKNEQKYCHIHKAKSHSTHECKKFSSMKYSDRKKIVVDNKLCFACLGSHRIADCNSNVKCERCNEKHLTLMHRDPRDQTSSNNSIQNSNFLNKSMCTYVCGNENKSKSCSKTVLIDVTSTDVPGRTLRCYAIVDEQSNCCLVDSKIPEYFNKTYPTEEFSLTTASGCSPNTTGMVVTGLQVKGVNQNKVINIPAVYSDQNIPDTREEVATPDVVSSFKHTQKYSNNFLPIDFKAEVLLLIGNNCSDAMETKCFTNKVPFIHKTSLGWAAVGSVCENVVSNTNFKALRTTVKHDHFSIKPKFSTPAVKEQIILKENVFAEFPDDLSNALSSEEEEFLKIMNDGLTIDKEGSIVAPLPLKTSISLPCNQEAVYRRTSGTLNRLIKQPAKLSECLASMQKSIDLGYVEKVPESEIEKTDNVNWLPIFPVVNQKKKRRRAASL